MRYFTVKYSKKPNGQTDESIGLTQNLRSRDLQEFAVIVDFRARKVVKASLDGKTIPKDFDRIVSFYHKHYQHVIDRLLKENGLVRREENADEKSTDNNTAADQQPSTSMAG